MSLVHLHKNNQSNKKVRIKKTKNKTRLMASSEHLTDLQEELLCAYSLKKICPWLLILLMGFQVAVRKDEDMFTDDGISCAL